MELENKCADALLNYRIPFDAPICDLRYCIGQMQGLIAAMIDSGECDQRAASEIITLIREMES